MKRALLLILGLYFVVATYGGMQLGGLLALACGYFAGQQQGGSVNGL